ncbi:multidrug efflux pump subunit AcrB [Litorivivens lipolytica]|uniref:Multidrug efflux pump subunit AcrB n=1 Tax=Litorivivens lipolytica TaxID=1524264 RepID=A0A7W4W586_9GAMM|nr:efflux RND transporter permease subunit [Litorivivens lipolytica]MBB3047693.1 multidrug efflux pump subunit AcrB [Litorivivens lipolytica]
MSWNERRSGAIGWMAHNPVAANLLMAVVMIAGLFSLMDLRKEVFPTFPTEMIRITVPYPGSSPTEVEEGILIKIEEALQDMEGIEEMTSEARENVGTVLVRMLPKSDMPTALNDVTSRVNAIASFPAEAEKPVLEEILAKVQTINLTIAAGGLSEHELKSVAEQVREDLLATNAITQIDLVGVRDYELAIELSDTILRQYGLTFDQVVNLVRSKSANLPGGNLRTDSGTITLRSQGQAYSGDDYRQLPLLTRPDGTRLLLGDIANVRDGFSEQPVLSRLNGEPGARLTIYTLGSQNALKISEVVKQYVDEKQASLPEGVTINAWFDNSRILKGRIDLLLKNAAQGGLLVLIALTLFLRLSMAFWVLIGVPFSFLGAMWMMGLPWFDYSINVLSLFGFLLVLGIVVDDAIVTGESGYTYLEREKQGIDSVVHGVKRVSVATIFGVITTMIAFTPMLTMTSDMGRFGSNIAFVVICCLLFSLIETKLILPTHLRHIDVHKARRGPLPALQRGFDRMLMGFIKNVYKPVLQTFLRYRYVTLAVFVGSFIVVLSLVPAGIVRFVFFPDIPSDEIRIVLRLPPSAPYQLTHRYALQVEDAANAVNERYREVSGDPRDVIADLEVLSESDDRADIWAALIPSEERNINSVTIAQWWREAIGPLPGIKELSFDAKAGPGGGVDLDVALESDDLLELQRAAADLKNRLKEIDGVFDIRDTFGAGAPEVDIQIKPAGELLGLGQAEIARQVRQAFFGAEIQRFQRGRHEVRVYARLPLEERDTLQTLERLWINLPNGERVPFSEVAEARYNAGISSIKRIDRERVVNIQTGIDKATTEPDEVVDKLRRDILPALKADHPSINYRFAGQVEEQQEDTRELKTSGLIVLLLIFAALAIPLKSYVQPLYIMSAIPFAVVGAIIGHWLTGNAFSFLSIVGVLALAGVVVNDSLVLVDFVNQKVAEGTNKLVAVVEAGQARFRAVILTSLTTFLGLLPIQLETSIQAQFIIPMAVSVGFGILFATGVTLFLVPILFYIANDVKRLFTREKTGSEVSA